MKTTLDLPVDLVREMKLRAVHEGRKLKDVAAEVFRRGLAISSSGATTPGVRVKFPLIETPTSANPSDEPGPDKIAELLINQEVIPCRFCSNI